ncbi:MAG: RNase adapter RapZ [Acidimicrobiales bacterium]|jgi:RNase adapter protein RapZ
MSDYLLITGMSGAGRSTAAAALEDAGWYVIDNMPPALLSAVADVFGSPGSSPDRVALVIGRGGSAQVAEALPAVDGLRASGNQVRIVYLDAPDHVLVRRFEGTRRRHPFGGSNVEDAIADERERLRAIRDRADLILDTGELNVNQLRNRVTEVFGDDVEEQMQTSVVSFGYKHGVPLDADVVLDLRFLPNPHWREDLRPLSGLDGPVREYVLSQQATKQLLDRLDALWEVVIPGYQEEGRSYLTIAFGCTGGRHRSVVIAEEVAKRLTKYGPEPTVFHRDIDR